MLKGLTAIECFSLCARLLLWGWVVATAHWVAGDSWGFMGHSIRFCSGDFFSGESTKSPLYTLLACAFSLPTRPFLGPLSWMGGGFAAVLLAQSLFWWGIGVFFRKKRLAGNSVGNVWQIVFHFDPLLMAYPLFLMSDSFFAALVFISTVLALPWFFVGGKGASPRAAALLGFCCALLILQRSVGLVWAAWLVFCLGITVFREPAGSRRSIAKNFAAFLAVLLLCLSPRFFYQWRWHHVLSLNSQAGAWLPAVAAAVESEGQGLSFKQAEDRWSSRHRGDSVGDVLRVFREHPWSLAKLSFKGIARTALGHVNVEWGLIATGKTVFGPAWFKRPEPFTGTRAGALYVSEFEAAGIALWVVGIVLVLAWNAWVHFAIAADLWRARARTGSASLTWALGGVALSCGLPLIFGDARFRLGYLPLLLAFWGMVGERMHEN